MFAVDDITVEDVGTSSARGACAGPISIAKRAPSSLLLIVGYQLQ